MSIITNSLNKQAIRCVTILDPHFSSVTPPSRKDNYWDSTKESVSQVVRFVAKNQVDYVLIAGDIFHRKAPSQNPTWFMVEVIELLREFEKAGARVLAIAGNHDCLFVSPMETLDKQPIGLLRAAKVIHLLDDSPVVAEGEGFTVKFAGVSYGVNSVKKFMDLSKDGATYLVALGHFWFGLSTGNFYGEPVYGPDTLHKAKADVMVIGHHHEDMGISRADGKVYVTHGSMSRTGAHASDLKRLPSVGYVEFSKVGILTKTLRLKLPKVEDIFDLEKITTSREEERAIDSFLEDVQQQILTSKDWKGILEEMNLAVELREMIQHYLQIAETSESIE